MLARSPALIVQRALVTKGYDDLRLELEGSEVTLLRHKAALQLLLESVADFNPESY